MIDDKLMILKNWQIIKKIMIFTKTFLKTSFVKKQTKTEQIVLKIKTVEI